MMAVMPNPSCGFVGDIVERIPAPVIINHTLKSNKFTRHSLAVASFIKDNGRKINGIKKHG